MNGMNKCGDGAKPGFKCAKTSCLGVYGHSPEAQLQLFHPDIHSTLP